MREISDILIIWDIGKFLACDSWEQNAWRHCVWPSPNEEKGAPSFIHNTRGRLVNESGMRPFSRGNDGKCCARVVPIYPLNSSFTTLEHFKGEMDLGTKKPRKHWV